MLFSFPLPRLALACGLIAAGGLSQSIAQAKKPASSAKSKALKGWKPFASKMGRFSALFPATPKSMVRDQGVYKAHAFYHSIPGGAYMVTYSDMRESNLSKERIQKFKPQEVLDDNLNGFISGTRGKLLSQKRLNWQGFPAREVSYDIPQLEARGRTLLIFARPFLYQVTTILPKDQAQTSASTTRAFLNSFQIQASGS